MTRLLSQWCSCSLSRATQGLAPVTLPSRSSSTSFSRSTSTTATPQPRTRQDPRWPGWTPTIGLELHVQIAGNHKLFSQAKAVYDAEPNRHVAHFDAALPGSLPVLNPTAVHLSLLAALALNCNINPHSKFDRKHYFYPDLPAGFQITQKYSPLAKDGLIRVRLDSGGGKGESKKKKKKSKTATASPSSSSSAGQGSEPDFVDVRIEQIQLEQDTAKSFHSPGPPSSTLIDLNRAGAALIEIVTKPDLKTPEQAGAFVKSLQQILRFVGVSKAGMEKGELRCDVNVSVARTGSSTKGTRCEIKNLNGVKFVMGAIEAEITRQIHLLESPDGERRGIQQATRGYNVLEGKTFHLRGKEDAVDYRYMPDPELGGVRVSQAQLTHLRHTLPELPDAAFIRLQSQYGLSARDAGVLVSLGAADSEGSAEEVGSEQGMGRGAAIGVRWFEAVVRGIVNDGDVQERKEGELKEAAKGAVNWLIHDLLGLLSKANLTLATCPISPLELAELVSAVKAGRITGTNARSLLRTFITSPSSSSPPPPSPTSSPPASPSPSPSSSFTSYLTPHLSRPPPPSASPASTSSSSSFTPSSSSSDLSPLLDAVILSLPLEAEKVRKGQTKVLMRLVGEAMKVSGGKVDAKRVREGFEERLLRGREGDEEA
ncbi:hypothetical protein JCM11641_002318 [Rhodosporidiobolus odoratus]